MEDYRKHSGQKMLYAKVIIEISHEAVDRIFEYKIPDHLNEQVIEGATVKIPFGAANRLLEGYVVGISEASQYPPEKLKEIVAVSENEINAKGQLLKLAAWMKQQYGSTMIAALRTVLPVTKKVGEKEKSTISLTIDQKAIEEQKNLYIRKNYVARLRVLKALQKAGAMEKSVLYKETKTTASVIEAMQKEGILQVSTKRDFRNPVKKQENKWEQHSLNEEQKAAVSKVMKDYEQNIWKTYLLYGVTGSGKTEVYMELIQRVIEKKRQVIVLIPEISLTFQTVQRFYARFGDRVSFVNSRLSKGEKYDQFVRAQKGEIDIMIGPRSALFTPFPNLGLMIIDEEHEGAYKSEITPKYHAKEVAIERAKMAGASVILGSATPSIESFTLAKQGTYELLTLRQRAGTGAMAQVSIVDLRKELKEGNRSMFSQKLYESMCSALKKGEQIMLFMNRRGYSGFVSCRSCGTVIQCPHCDVSLTYHKGGWLVCHYCGFQRRMPAACPTCKSPHIGGFGTGTQKVEAALYKLFPDAKIMRMDMDTTRKKGSYDQMLHDFSMHKADILVGTQMIVKGHDFSNVTVMGILAADLSLHGGDYRGGERTFQLLTQAAGRAGRGKKKGTVVIQTYEPEHYAIVTAKDQDYDEFYRQEITFRRLLKYPPVYAMMVIFAVSPKEKLLQETMEQIADFIKHQQIDGLGMIGPCEGRIYKVKDQYRRVLYVKHIQEETLIGLRQKTEQMTEEKQMRKDVHLYYDLNPMGLY